MKAVVDTNVIAYYLLGTPDFAAEAREFWRGSGDLLAPASWEAELTNVVWMAVRTGGLTDVEACLKLHLAARLGIHSVATRMLWQGALIRALASDTAVYDTLFVELADREHVPLITFDQKLLDAYPAIAKRPKDLLGS
jgi:predicted nucleic acid-binding protein